MRISKSKIFTMTLFIMLFCFDWFEMKPRINEKYLNQDLWDFEKGSWKFSLITFVLIYLGAIIFKRLKSNKSDKKSVVLYLSLLIPTALLAFLLNGLTERTTLYLNSFYHKKTIRKEYIIQRYDNNGVFQLFDEKDEIIALTKELDGINSKRKSKNLVSLYELNNNEKVVVEYQIGFLKTKYVQ